MNNDLYFKDAFTEVDGEINLDANNINVNCITSRNNKFHLDSDGNLVVNSITTATGGGNLDFDAIYPVGSIYLSVSSASPETLFGGVWERITDKFLLACGNSYSAGSIGGNTTHSYSTRSHTLTVSEIPGHNHGTAVQGRSAGGLGGSSGDKSAISYWENTSGQATSYTGGNESHDHGTTYTASSMPPYLAVYMWKRVS